GSDRRDALSRQRPLEGDRGPAAVVRLSCGGPLLWTGPRRRRELRLRRPREIEWIERPALAVDRRTPERSGPAARQGGGAVLSAAAERARQPIERRSLGRQRLEVNRVAHRLVAGGVGMEMIALVEFRQGIAGLLRIDDD